jgi:shikimate dehydrogenase
MFRLAVLGQPIAHSRSPAMHTAALEALGLAGDWSYEAIEISPDELEARVRVMPDQGFAGANATVPHKLAALRLADRASETARAIGAANTLTFTARGIEAENTDAPGLLDSLPLSPAGARALVLGAGGSARACAWALREAGAEVSIWNRTAERAEGLASDLGVAAIAPPEGQPLRAGAYELIVNATSVGLAAANAAPAEVADPVADLKTLRLDADSLGASHVVVDLVYGSSATPLATVARERGSAVVDGLDVLVRQGARSLRLWTGLDPPIDVMREAARNP